MDLPAIVEFCKKYGQQKFTLNKLDYTLWPAEEIEKLNAEYKTQEFIPDFVGFGSDGGDELLATNLKNGKIYSIPFIPMEEKSAVEIAKNFSELLRHATS